MTVAFFFSDATRAMTLHMKRLALGSMPVEGSSRKMILGLPIIAIATDSFLLFPPERVPESLSSYSPKFISLIFDSIAASFSALLRDLRS